MKVLETPLAGAVELQPQVFGDERGFFMEAWNQSRFAEIGLPHQFVQANVSRSAKGVLRGLHYQYPNPQGKLVWVLEGQVYDVAVDIRRGSPQFGQWHGVVLDAEKKNQFYVPAGFAHGFCVLSEAALFTYLCTTEYDADADATIAWDDPGIGVRWPIAEPTLSQKDSVAPRLAEIAEGRLPAFDP